MRSFEEKEAGVFTIKAAKVGSASYNWIGEKLTFSEESLVNYAHTWAGGIITLNHMYVDDDNSMILSSEFNTSDKLVYMDIKVANEMTAERIRAKEPTGVSIEANIVGDTPNGEIIAFTGTGVSIVFYPDQPACPTEEGCGIVSKTLNTDDSLSNRKRASANTATPSRVETILSGGITIDKIHETGTPGATLSTETGGAVSPEDFQTVSAKLLETRRELAELKAGAKDQEYLAKIQAKDSQIDTLKAEIDKRDSDVAAGLVEDILKMDPEFSAEGKNLSELTSIHASLTRIVDKIKSTEEGPEDPEDPEEVEAGEFIDPRQSAGKGDALSIGGISGGVWTGGNGKIPISAKVPRGGQ